MPPQIIPKSILGPAWAQICAKDARREPGTTYVHDFWSILASCLMDFCPSIAGATDPGTKQPKISEFGHVPRKIRIDHDRRTLLLLTALGTPIEASSSCMTHRQWSPNKTSKDRKYDRSVVL